MLKLFTDTDTDTTPAIAAEYGYSLISMPYSIDTKTIHPYEDFDTFDHRTFYDMLRSGVIPTTSAISKEKYVEYFEPDFAAGNEILYVHFSRAMSNSFVAMDQAVAELKAKYPAARFEEIDTKGISIASLVLVREVGQRVKAGMSLDDVLAWAVPEVEKFATYFFSDDLKFFRRSGRVSGLAATMGTIIGLRPIIYMNQEGKMVSIGTEKGRFKAVSRLARTVEELGDEIEKYHVCIAHSDALDMAQEVGNMILEKHPGLNIEYVVVNPTAGSHCGPNSIGVCFHAKHR